MTNQPIEFKKIREFGEIVGDTFLFIRQNIKPLLKTFFYMSGIFILAALVTSVFTQLQIADIANGARTGSVDIDPGNPFSMLYGMAYSYGLLIIFMLLSYTSVFASTLSFISLYIQKGNVAPSIPEVWTYFKYYYFRLMWSGIVMTLFLFLSFLCCFLPGVWVFPAVSIFYPIMVLENATLGFSFSRSFKLINNEWWITFATLVVIYIITQSLTFILQLPALIIGWASAFTHLEQPITNTYAIATGIASSLGHIFLIVPIVATALIYYNLVERKESSGLIDRIQQFGESSNPDQSTPEEY